MISLTFFKISNCSHSILGRTKGFWSGRYGFKSQHLPLDFQLYKFNFDLRGLFFSTPIKIDIFRRVLLAASSSKMLTFVGTVFLLHYCSYYYYFQDHNEISTFSPNCFPQYNMLKHTSAAYGTGKYSQIPEGPFYENFRFCETKSFPWKSWSPVFCIKFFCNNHKIPYASSFSPIAPFVFLLSFNFIELSSKFCCSVVPIFLGLILFCNRILKCSKFLWNPLFSFLLHLRFYQTSLEELNTLHPNYLQLINQHMPDPHSKFFFWMEQMTSFFWIYARRVLILCRKVLIAKIVSLWMLVAR